MAGELFSGEHFSVAEITAIVLAGGRGRRMGEADKGLVLLHGRPLVSWVLECVTPQVDEVLISANRNLDRYQKLGFPVLTDELPDFSGPLAGLHRSLAVVARPLWLCVPCDTPFLPLDLVSRLLAALLDEGADVAVPDLDGCLQPAICLGYTHLDAHLKAYLEAGGRRVGEWQSQLKRARVPFSDIKPFSNLNTPQELALAASRAAL
jgi:molybdopterin-guanine dinucleotide biosynthesis protein A